MKGGAIWSKSLCLIERVVGLTKQLLCFIPRDAAIGDTLAVGQISAQFLFAFDQMTFQHHSKNTFLVLRSFG